MAARAGAPDILPCGDVAIGLFYLPVALALLVAAVTGSLGDRGELRMSD